MSESDKAVTKNDMKDAIGRSLEAGMRDFNETDYRDGQSTDKFLGFEMDKGVVRLVKGVYTGLVGEFNNFFAPKVYETIREHAPKIKISGKLLQEKALNRTAAGGALLVGTGVMFMPAITTVISHVRDHHHARDKVARHLAPVLDDIYGKHSVGVYNRVKREENSVIWAHRQRMSKEASAATSRTIWSALAENAANLFGQHLNVRSLLTGKSINSVIIDKYQEEAAELSEQYMAREEERVRRARQGSKDLPEVTEEEQIKRRNKIEMQVAERLKQQHGNDGLRAMFFGANFSLPQIVEKMAESSQARMKQSRQPFSAYEMIQTLAEQMENNPGHRDYFQLPGSHGREMPLAKYLAELVKLHQREMCDLDPNYSELRPSLHEDLEELLKPIAEALHKGKLSPIMLVRLVGEGKIVKNRGRGLASPTELNTTLESYVGKSHGMNTRDPKDYLSNSNFSLAQLKESLRTLEGEERLHLASCIPDGVLKSAGYSDKEIKAVQAHRLEEGYHGVLMHAIMGAAAKGDDELKAGGLSSAQIEQLREAAGKLESHGVKALEAIVSSPTNPDGVDSTALADLAVPKTAVGDRHYLSKLAKDGKQAGAQPNEARDDSAEIDADERSQEMSEAAMARMKSGKHTSHAEKHGSHSKHAAREERRREHHESHHAGHGA